MNFCQNEERVKRGWLILGGLLAAVASSTAQTVVNVNSAASSIPNNTNLPNGATVIVEDGGSIGCLLYTSPSPRDRTRSRMPSSA